MRTQAREDWFPLDAGEHERQIEALIRALGKRPRRVLDLGIGSGRAAAPLVKAGHRVVGVDKDPSAVWACAALDIACVHGDFIETGRASAKLWRGLAARGPFDAAVCLGNTFLHVCSPAAAVALMARLAGLLPGAGRLFIDDFAPLWREVAEGYWQEGFSGGRAQQLVWGEGDNVLAIRKGKRVRARSWKPEAGDEALRLWSRGELELLGRASGWAFAARPGEHLGVFSRATSAPRKPGGGLRGGRRR